MIKEYNKISSVELWNFESINSSISQIKYYKDSAMFGNSADLNIVVDSFIKTLDHQQSQTEKGMKFMPGDSELVYRAPIKFYVNEVVLGNNTILLELNNNRLSFITYNVLSYLISKRSRVLPIRHLPVLILYSADQHLSVEPAKKNATDFLMLCGIK